jgi:hypothetical protein
MRTRQSLILLTAISAALAAPLVGAQGLHAGVGAGLHASAQVTPPTPPMTPPMPATPTEDMGAMKTPAVPATPATPAIPPTGASASDDTSAATRATPATPATPATAASGGKVSWSALDTDGDGALSTAEAASVKSLSDVFAKADANADGKLTTDEYKAYLSVHGKAETRTKHSH